jgi:hypothetical protein
MFKQIKFNNINNIETKFQLNYLKTFYRIIVQVLRTCYNKSKRNIFSVRSRVYANRCKLLMIDLPTFHIEKRK